MTGQYHGGMEPEILFFRVPEEGHELSRSGRPDRRVARLRAYLDWWRENL
jgi:dipeptidyl aminopeptidase/acylaminoacyl peptidase